MVNFGVFGVVVYIKKNNNIVLIGNDFIFMEDYFC